MVRASQSNIHDKDGCVTVYEAFWQFCHRIYAQNVNYNNNDDNYS